MKVTMQPEAMPGLAWGITIFAGLTMVSNVKFYSFKTINLKRSVPFVAVLSIVLAFALVSYQPALVFFGAFVAYALSGYVIWAWRALKPGRAPQPSDAGGGAGHSG